MSVLEEVRKPRQALVKTITKSVTVSTAIRSFPANWRLLARRTPFLNSVLLEVRLGATVGKLRQQNRSVVRKRPVGRVKRHVSQF